MSSARSVNEVSFKPYIPTRKDQPFEPAVEQVQVEVVEANSDTAQAIDDLTAEFPEFLKEDGVELAPASWTAPWGWRPTKK